MASEANEKTYQVNQEIVSRNNQDGSVVLMKMDDSEVFYKIEGVAALVWKEVKSGKNLSQIKTALIEEFDVSEEQLNSDVTSFINDLKAKDIIE